MCFVPSGLASDVATLVRSLSEEREVVFSARQTVIEITELLFSRQYSDIIINTSSLSDVVSSLLDMTHRFIEQTQNNTLIAQNLSSSLMEVSIPLQSAGILIAETLGITREAFSLFDEALTIDGNLTVRHLIFLLLLSLPATVYLSGSTAGGRGGSY